MTAGRRTRWWRPAASALPGAGSPSPPAGLSATSADPAAVRGRRRRVVIATGLGGAGLLGVSLSTEPGSARFYVLTMAVAGTWVAGALGSGPVYLGSTRGRESTRHRLVVMPVLTGVGAFGAFYGAARLARHIPLLDQAIGGILRYADEGSTALVLLTACTNGAAEELFFRGALWSAVEDSRPVAKTTLAYAAMTLATRNPALVLSGTVMSVLLGFQRRASGGILAPALIHVTWSVLMLNYLPPLFRTPRRPQTTRD